MTATDIRRRISELEPGDLVDLEGDPFADPPTDPDTFWTYEYGIVSELEIETPDCTLVYFENGPNVGFPPNHVVTVNQDS
jgi:hypothetical protein